MSAAEQIRWGREYIRRTYGSAAAAQAHESETGWYDEGGSPPPEPKIP